MWHIYIYIYIFPYQCGLVHKGLLKSFRGKTFESSGESIG